jgi:hypothetical protein
MITCSVPCLHHTNYNYCTFATLQTQEMERGKLLRVSSCNKSRSQRKSLRQGLHSLHSRKVFPSEVLSFSQTHARTHKRNRVGQGERMQGTIGPVARSRESKISVFAVDRLRDVGALIDKMVNCCWYMAHVAVVEPAIRIGCCSLYSPSLSCLTDAS